MREFSYCPRLSVSESIEQFEITTRNIGNRIRGIVKFFGIFCGYLFINFLFAFLFTNLRNVSLDTYRLVSEGIREVTMQDLFACINFIYESKFACLSLAIVVMDSFCCFVQFIYERSSCKAKEKQTTKNVENDNENIVSYVNAISYKQHVAFLA